MKQMVIVFLLFCGLCILPACKRKQVRSQPSWYDYQNGGRSAIDILRATEYTALDIQIQYMPGCKLEKETIKNVTDFLERICDKPDGINVSQSKVDLSADTITIDHVMDIEKRYRTAYSGNNTIVIYILVTNGYSDDPHIAAYTYYNTSVVIFGKTISDNIVSQGKVHMETFLLMHEMGHIMGLVNMGTPMQVPHEDSVIRHHCTNAACTMNYGGVNTELDSACLTDLEAAKKGKWLDEADMQ